MATLYAYNTTIPQETNLNAVFANSELGEQVEYYESLKQATHVDPITRGLNNIVYYRAPDIRQATGELTEVVDSVTEHYLNCTVTGVACRTLAGMNLFKAMDNPKIRVGHPHPLPASERYSRSLRKLDIALRSIAQVDTSILELKPSFSSGKHILMLRAARNQITITPGSKRTIGDVLDQLELITKYTELLYTEGAQVLAHFENFGTLRKLEKRSLVNGSPVTSEDAELLEKVNTAGAQAISKATKDCAALEALIHLRRSDGLGLKHADEAPKRFIQFYETTRHNPELWEAAISIENSVGNTFYRRHFLDLQDYLKRQRDEKQAAEASPVQDKPLQQPVKTLNQDDEGRSDSEQ